MSPRRLTASAAVCGTVVLAGWGAVEFTGVGSPRIESTAAPVEGSRIALATAHFETVELPEASTPQTALNATAIGDDAPAADVAKVDSRSPDPGPAPVAEPPPMQVASVNPGDSAKDEVSPPSAADRPAPCVDDECVDQYLWSLYQRTPKLDTIKVPEKIKVTVKRKGKMRTVTRTITKLVDEDFTWKDPKAAEKAGIPLRDYVIGGMERSFRLKLYEALRALDDAGLAPGITSAFRDDYRQEIASGLKAASNRSYHGGSLRGGYGHGLAADVVSVRGGTRMERWISSEALWKWIDANGKEFGIGRPYLDRDPPHVGPTDGKEYVDRRTATKTKLAQQETKKGKRPTAHDGQGTARRTTTAKPKVKSS